MKKVKKEERGQVFSPLCKVLLAFILIGAWGILSSYADESHAQETRLTFSVKNATVKSVLDRIEKSTDFSFMYENNAIDVNSKVTFEAKDETIENILNRLLGDEVDYRIVGKHILLFRSEKQPAQKEQKVADVQQQQRTVTGKVTDPNGQPLPGATVMIKGTSIGTITDADGNYSLRNVPDDATLVFSFVGMQTQEINVGNRTRIDVTLQEEAVALQEVVAVGYGTMKKSDLTGAVASIKSDDISSFPTTSLMKALQGRASGIQVQQNSGAPGANIQIRIRGTNSIMGSSEPLWVIDGFPGNAGMLNTLDIESIEILKDASATAIYGSRGANGVILVTSKRGREGITRVDYEGSYSINSLRKKLDLMDAKEYAQFVNFTRLNDNLREYFSQDEIDKLGKGTDWQDLAFRNAPLHQHYLSVTGGNNKTKFLVSGGYYNEAGIVINSGYQRVTLKTNIEHEISSKSKILFNSILNRSDTNSKNVTGGNRGGSLFSGIPSAAPTLSPYTEDGAYTLLAGYYPFSSNVQLNPIAYENEVTNKSYSNRVNANVSFIFEPLNGLSIRISGNVLNVDSRGDNYTTKKYPASQGNASVSTSQNLNLNSDNIITYSKTINDSHNLNLMAGLTYESSTSTSLGASGSGFLSDVTETHNLGSATTIGTPSTSYSKWAILSYLGRLNYSYKNKYLLTASFRGDGSSRYSEGNKWGYFPSGAFAWRISEEEFMKNNNLISDLKIRIGYGVTGNTAISPYYTLEMLSSGKVVFGKELYTYFAPSTRLPSKDLRWETTEQFNIGADIGIVNNRFHLTADYYNKLTRDLLNNVQLPASGGYTTTVQNVGRIRNKGIELQLDASIYNNREFKWDVTGNFSLNRNKVDKLYEGQDILGLVTSGLTVIIDNYNILREGYPFSAFYGYQEDGYDERGYVKYKDNDGEEGISPADKTIIGDPNPDFIYGLSSNLSYKNFEFSFFIQGSQGNDIMSFSMINQAYDYGIGLNTFKELLYNSWTPENPNAKYPIISVNNKFKMSDRFVYDGSYLRLKNIQLSYNIPVNGVEWLKKAQIYISGQNLLTITSYPWWDPEINTYGGSTSINQGVDWYSYPTAKGITMGVKLSF